MFEVLIYFNDFFCVFALYSWIFWSKADFSDLSHSNLFFILISFRISDDEGFWINFFTFFRISAFWCWLQTSLTEGSSCINRKFSVPALYSLCCPFLWVICDEWWGLALKRLIWAQSICGQCFLITLRSQPIKHQSFTASEIRCM